MSSNSWVDDHSVADRWDRAFRTLSQQPRRQLLLSLSNASPTAWLELPEAALSSHYEGTRRALCIELRHHHLPALSDVGYVQWDDEAFEVSRGPNFREAAAVLAALVSAADDLPDRLVHGCEPLERRATE